MGANLLDKELWKTEANSSACEQASGYISVTEFM